MGLTVLKFSYISRAGGRCVRAAAFTDIVKEIAVVGISVGEIDGAFTVHLTVNAVAFVDIPVLGEKYEKKSKSGQSLFIEHESQ